MKEVVNEYYVSMSDWLNPKSLQKNEESYPFDKLAEGDVVECIRDFTIDMDIGKQFIVQRDSNQGSLCIIDRRGIKWRNSINSTNFKIISKANSVNQTESNIVEQFQIW